MGLAVYRPAHTRRCSLWAPVRLPEAWKPLVQAPSLTRVRKLAADREAVEDDLLCHRLSPETAELGRPTTRERAKL
jgi:hypothetical protein